MTYFGFLGIFLGIPLVLLSAITIMDWRRGHWMPPALNSWRPWVVLTAICIVALIYTTPWDNYLVATGVWWYDPALVNGLVIGWVPIEEYVFFILQPIMTGLFLLLLMRHLPTNPVPADHPGIRRWSTVVVTLVWVASVILLLSGYRPGTYLALELSWALVPVILQLAFGADILWRHRRPVLLTIVLATVYLSFADALAIGSGTWTIDPQQSFEIYLFGVLPIEEMIFFLLTNTLVVLGVTLVMSEESQPRAALLERVSALQTFLDWVRPPSQRVTFTEEAG